MGDEVKVTLVADDKATETIHRVQEGFKNLHEEQGKHHEHAKHGGGEHEGVGSKAMEFAKGMILERAAEKVVDVVKEQLAEVPKLFGEAMDAAAHEMNDKRAVAGALSLADRTGAGFDQLMDKASFFQEDLKAIAVEAGVTADSLTDAFASIAARTSKSASEVEHLTESLAYAGKAVNGGPQALAGGFEMLEIGVVRARNPVVQLIAATHLLQGNAKQVAMELQKLSPEKQIELGTKAIELMGTKMKEARPTIDELKTSLKQTHEQMLEAFGMPMADRLIPALMEVKEFLVDNHDVMEKAAHDTGVFFGKYIDETAEEVHKLVNMWNSGPNGPQDTKEALKDGAEAIKTAFKWAFEASEKAAEMYVTAFKKAGSLFEGAKHWLSDTAEAGHFGNGAHDMAIKGKMGGMEDEMHKLAGESADPESLEKMKKLRHEHELLSMTLFDGSSAAKDYEERMQALADLNRKSGESLDRTQYTFDVDSYTRLYNNAARAHDAGVQLYAAKIMAGSEGFQEALLKSGTQLEGGFSELTRLMRESGDEEGAHKFSERIKEGKGEKVKPVNVFTGAITIQQDFRNEDPDRIAVIFHDALRKNAENRLAARTGQAFGG